MQIGPTSHWFFSQRTKLHYVDWGNHDAPPLILMHGGKDHCRSWDWVAEHLRHDWHVIALDLRGHGDSDWTSTGDYSLTSHLCDMVQLIEQLDLAPITIISHSFGGQISARYAGVYPEKVKKLVLIEGLGHTPRFLKRFDGKTRSDRLRDLVENRRKAAARTIKRYDTMEEAYQRMHSANERLSEEQARHLTLHGVRQNEDGSYSWKFDNYTNFYNDVDMPPQESRALWENISCPVLMFYGKDSWATTPKEDGRGEHFKNYKLVVYENAGHWVHHDQLDKLIKEIKGFI